MPSRLRCVLGKLPSQLLLGAVRVTGTRGFLFAVQAARFLRMLPPAYRPGKDKESILVVALTPHLGDAVMLMPLMEALSKVLPGASVDLAIERGVASLFYGAPGIRKVYPLRLGTAPPDSTAGTLRRIGAIIREYRTHMRDCHPAVCLMPRWGDDLFRSLYLAVLTGAPRRIGFSSGVGWPRYRLAPYRDALLTEATRSGNSLHEPDRSVLLAQAAHLLPSGSLAASAKRSSATMLRLAGRVEWQPLAERLGLSASRAYAVIAPGASQAHKIWPAERWGIVIRYLEQQGIFAVLLSGTADRNIAQNIHHSRPEAVLIAGTTTLAESAAILQHGCLFLGNDSGPAHMAGALGIPTIVLSISSPATDADDPFSPERNRPMGPNVHVLQPLHSVEPCRTTCVATEPHCIRAITAESVLRTVEQLLPNAGCQRGAA